MAGIAITPDGKTVYGLNYTSGTVTPIQTATNTAGAPINVGGSPGTGPDRAADAGAATSGLFRLASDGMGWGQAASAVHQLPMTFGGAYIA